MTVCIAIDIGLTGALAAVNSYGHPAVHDLPTVPDGAKSRRLDGRGIVLLMRTLIPAGHQAQLVIEDVRPRPMGNGNRAGNTIHSQGSLMRSRGIVEAVADILRVDLVTVQPQTWKRHFGLLRAEKAASLEMARKLYPGMAADLKRVKDHNRAEALLMAHWLLGEVA